MGGSGISLNKIVSGISRLDPLGFSSAETVPNADGAMKVQNVGGAPAESDPDVETQINDLLKNPPIRLENRGSVMPEENGVQMLKDAMPAEDKDGLFGFQLVTQDEADDLQKEQILGEFTLVDGEKVVEEKRIEDGKQLIDEFVDFSKDKTSQEAVEEFETSKGFVHVDKESVQAEREKEEPMGFVLLDEDSLEGMAESKKLGGVAGPVLDNEAPVENGKQDVGKKAYDLEKTEDLRDFVEASIQGVRKKVMSLGDIDMRIADLREQISKMPSDKAETYKKKLQHLETIAATFRWQCDQATKLLEPKHTELSQQELDSESATQREERLQKDIEKMGKALKKFHSEFYSATISKPWYSPLTSFVNRTVTGIRNRLFPNLQGDRRVYEHKSQIEQLGDILNKFDNAYADLFRDENTDLHRFEGLDTFAQSAKDTSELMAAVSEMIEAKTENSVANMCFNSVKAQLRDIAENGGYKVLELDLSVGFGVHITDSAELTVGGKGKYVYKVFSTGDGSISIEHVGGGGVAVDAKFRVGNLLKVGANGELMGSHGKVTTYADLDSATRNVFTLSNPRKRWGVTNSAYAGLQRFNPLFIKGRGYGKNFVFACKYLGKALAFLPKMALKGIDALHKLRTGEHLMDMFDSAKRHSDEKFFQNLKDRGLISKADKLLAPRHNILITQKRSFDRIEAKLDGRFSLNFHAHVQLDGGVSAMEDKGKKTNYRTYMTYLTSEQNGKVAAHFNALESDPAAEELVDVGNVKGILNAPVGNEKQKAALADRILAEIQKLVDAEEEYGSGLEKEAQRLRDAGSKAGIDYRLAAANYRTGMLALAALYEKFEDLDGLDLDRKAAFEQLRDKATANFENPAVLFPDQVFQDNFFMEHTVADGTIVTKREFSFEYDFLSELKTNMLTGTHLADGGSNEAGVLNAIKGIDGKMIGRAGAMGAVEGTQKLTGFLKGSVGVKVVEEVPTKESQRPWGNQSRKTMTFQFSSGTTFDLIMEHYCKTLCTEANIPMPKDAKWKDMLTNASIGAAVSAGMQLLNDFLAKMGGKSLNDATEEAAKNWVKGSFLDTMRSGQTVQFEFHDGRLSAISLGVGDQLKVKVSAQLGPLPIVVGFGVDWDAQENKTSFWSSPSYDALLGKCDSYLQKGNVTQWKQFAMRNQKGFARMCDIFAEQLNGAPDEPGKVGKPEDPMRADDRKRIDRMRARMEADIAKAKGELKARLVANRTKLDGALATLMEAAATKDARLKTIAMRTVLELTVRHFDIAQDKGRVIDSVAGFGEFSDEEIQEARKAHPARKSNPFVGRELRRDPALDARENDRVMRPAVQDESQPEGAPNRDPLRDAVETVFYP